MKTIGLIGGMSWESTATYYRLINEEVRNRLGGLHSAECLIYSVDFAPIEEMQREGRWEEAGDRLGIIAKKLEAAGAEGIVLCTNTMHKVASNIEAAIRVAFLHIAEATSRAIMEQQVKHVLLLGTKYTMEQPFISDILKENNLIVSIPNEQEREEINRIIFEELCLGKIDSVSSERMNELIQSYEAEGIQGVILGCTELNLLIHEGTTNVNVFDTTAIHVKEAVDFLLSD